MTKQKEWLAREEVCKRLGISMKTLNRRRREGKISGAVGPFGTDSAGRSPNDPYLSMNAVRYHVDEVERFRTEELES